MFFIYALALGALAHAKAGTLARPITLDTSQITQSSQDSTHKENVRDTLSRRTTILAPTVVTATGESRRRTESSTTIDVVSRQELERTRPSHPSGIMNRVPGVHVSELSAEGHSTAIRQPITTKAMYLYLEDGIPTRATGFFNHNALYEVNLPQSGGIEVLKGPGTALYGSDAIGGVINVLSKAPPARPTFETSLEGGGYGWARALVTGGFRTPRHGVRADLNLTRATGWQDDAPYKRQSGSIRWDVITPKGLFMKTLATTTRVDQHDVPTVSKSLFTNRNPINTAPISFREVRAARLSTTLEHTSENTFWSITPYARHNILNLLPSWQITYDPQVWYQKNNSFGLLAKVRRDVDPLKARFIAGVDADFSPGHFAADQALLDTTPASGTTPARFLSYTTGVRHYDYDVTYHSVSPYIQADFTPTPRLRIDAGLRYDVAGYKYETLLSPISTGNHRVPSNTSVSYNHLSPKLGVTFDVTRSINIYGSYRHGFRAPSQNQLFQQNSADNTVNLKPVRTNSYEVGIRGDVGARMLYSLTMYHMVTNNDIINYRTPLNTTEATNAGETRHRGIETSLGVMLFPTLRMDVAYSISSQRYIQWDPSSTVSYSGNRIEQAPRDLGNLLITYSPRLFGGGRIAAEVVHTGRYAMDPQNSHYYPGHTVAHLHANYILRHGGELFARIANLTNRTYAEVASYTTFQQEQYTPGAPRTVYAGVRYRWTR
jgi:iron complex outermembrane receptor protein